MSIINLNISNQQGKTQFLAISTNPLTEMYSRIKYFAMLAKVKDFSGLWKLII